MDPASRPPDLSKKLPPLSELLKSRPKPSSTPPADPPPETPALPPPPPASQLHFEPPSRRILSDEDHALFLSSTSYSLVTGFVFGLADAVSGKKVSTITAQPAHPTITQILELVDAAIALVAAHPPLDAGGSRFGNPAFRDLFDDIEGKLPAWHREILDIQDEGAITELATYFLHSLGSRQRLDYGSGHELNFALWLLCLNRLGKLPESAFAHAAVLAFPRYLRLARAVQSAYYLEPAGSHGVWGLDDFQFLPFLFGAAQLARHPVLRPKSIHHAAVLEECKDEYLYFEQVVWVNSTKNVEGLRWHSPMLDDISAARSWAKVEGGMRKMFVGEVLGKKAVMQHFLFGGLIPAVEGMSVDDGRDIPDSEHPGHDHGSGSPAWGDCCGIRVPSAIGAQQEMMKNGAAPEKLRRIPFD